MTNGWALTRRTLLVAAAGVALSFAGVGTASASTKIQKLVTPGGIEAWFVQDATVPLIAMEYAFAGGGAQDPADKAGVSNLVASLMDEGAADLDSKAFRERLERRAIELNFNATRDYLRGSLRMLSENRDEAFGLLKLALSSPRFDDSDVERIRAQVLSSLRRETTNPNSLASRKFLELAYGDHPYARSTNGTLTSVPTITIDDLKAYKNRIVARDTLRVAVVGDIDAASLSTLLDSTFASLPAKAQLTAIPEVKAARPPQAASVTLDVPQTVVMFGAPGIKRDDPNFMAAYIVNHIIGGGSLTSRLYSEVREKRGLAYSVSTSLLWMQHSGLYIGSTATRADRATQTLDLINNEIKRMADSGPTQQELDEAKSYLKGSQMLALDTSSKLASAMLQYQLDGLGVDYIEKRNSVVDAVTLDQTREAAKRLLSNGLLSVAVGRTEQAATQPPSTAPKAN